jgi:hypothetical protein
MPEVHLSGWLNNWLPWRRLSCLGYQNLAQIL